MENKKIVLEPKDENAHKFRRGKPGGYVDYLSKKEIEFVKDNFSFSIKEQDDYYKEIINESL